MVLVHSSSRSSLGLVLAPWVFASGVTLAIYAWPEAPPVSETGSVQCETRTRCTVDPALGLAVLGHQGSDRSFRLMPYARGGAIDGFKLYGVRSGSPLAALGFNNGDVLTHVDGRPLLSSEALAEARLNAALVNGFTIRYLRRDVHFSKKIVW